MSLPQAELAHLRDLAASAAAPAPATPADPAAPVPRCPCGAPVDAALLEIREFFPSLSPDLCTACYALAERESAEKVRDQAGQAERRHRLARLDATIPPEMLETELGHPAFNPALWLQVCGWKPDLGRWLLITGLPGRCKTRVVALLAKALILDGVMLHWATAIELQSAVEDMRSHDRSLYEPARARLHEWKKAAVLVLDDLGKNEWTKSIEARLFELIDHRKVWKLPTIITANTPLPELLRGKAISIERGGPIVGRILEAARGWTIEAPEIQRARTDTRF